MGQDSIGDILRGSLGSPLSAGKPSEPVSKPEQIEEQVRQPTDEEMAALEALAIRTAEIQDRLKAATGNLGRELKLLKAQLKDQLMQFGMEELKIAGRPPIELSSSNQTKPNRGKIIAACVAIKGDEKEGKKLGADIWKRIGTTTSYSLSIPDVSPPDA